MINTNTLGIVIANFHDKMFGGLTTNRTTASVPFGGRYRLIDFVLSNMSNSGISKVGVITKNNYQSLMEHLGSGSEWDLSRKFGGLSVMPPFSKGQYEVYKGHLDALNGILSYLENSTEKYVLVADANVVSSIDYNKVIEEHIQTNAKVTVIAQNKTVTDPLEKAVAFAIDEKNTMIDIFTSVQENTQYPLYLDMFVMNKDYLIGVLKECGIKNRYHFIEDFIVAAYKDIDIHVYLAQEMVYKISNISAYYKANMALLNSENRERVFYKERPIYTRISDEAPVRYGQESVVKNSLIANGCMIDGTVENSIIFRGVTVKKGAVIKNSILMQGTIVGENTVLKSVISDKNVTIRNNKTVSGHESYPIFIEKGVTV